MFIKFFLQLFLNPRIFGYLMEQQSQCSGSSSVTTQEKCYTLSFQFLWKKITIKSFKRKMLYIFMYSVKENNKRIIKTKF